MIVLAVMTYNGAAAEPIEARFDELGGTIGRPDRNLIVVPAPERTISRVHGKVVYRNGSYAIEDRGSNPILVNGNVVGHGKEWPLAPGDVVQIGGYELGVRASGSPAASTDPFADVFGTEPDALLTAPMPSAAPGPPPPPAPPRAGKAPPPRARRRRRRPRRWRRRRLHRAVHPHPPRRRQRRAAALPSPATGIRWRPIHRPVGRRAWASSSTTPAAWSAPPRPRSRSTTF